MVTKNKDISNKLQVNIDLIREIMGNSSDFIIREIIIASGKRVALLFLDGMVDRKSVDHTITSLLDRSPADQVTMNNLLNCVLDVGDAGMISDVDVAMEHILSGGLLVLLDGSNEGIYIIMPGWEARSIEESKTQSVVIGPKDSFTETLGTNTTLVRRRVKDTRVRTTMIQVGSITKTNVVTMYISGVAEKDLVQQLTSRLESISLVQVLDGQYLEEALRGKKQQSIFPLFYTTDRPDSIAAGIMEGRIAIFIDGSPFVILAPSLFVDFMQSAEDYYQSYYYSSFIRIIRYLALSICMLAPAIYIALTTIHQDMIPTELLLSLAAQREGVPFPAFIEAMMMEIVFEILREAGIRMPRTVGQAVSIVGTLVIGQAAVEAGVVSAVMVIIVAITAISSFVIPSYAMATSIRLLRFIFMGLAAILGVFGLTIGMFILVVHLCSLQSLGMPYMSPFAPYNQKEQRDAVLRFPFRSNNKTKADRR